MIATLINILIFILIFGFMVFIHEFGHFVTAKIFGVEVKEFGFGYPPRIMKLFQWRETEFTLNWIPFGGFVMVDGENDPDVPGGFASAAPWKRFIFLIGGSFMNICVGILLFSIVFIQVGRPLTSIVSISDISPNSPAETAGLLAGDRIDSIDGEPVYSIEKVIALVDARLGDEITFTYERDGELTSVNLVPRVEVPPNEGAIGIVMTNPVEKISWMEAVPAGIQMTIEQTKQLLLLPSNLIKGSITQEEARIVGPKGVYDLYAHAKEMDEEYAAASSEPVSPLNSLWLWAVFSVAIGLTNLLPIPRFGWR